MSAAPVYILGWDEANNYWAAIRDGEPSFTGVQSLGDAYMACNSRGADLIVADDVYAELVARGEAPPSRPRWVLRPER